MGVLTLPGNPGYGMSGFSYGKTDGVRTAQETFSRWFIQGSNSVPLVSGRLHFTFWQAEDNLTVANFGFPSGGTAAGATPTLARIGLYTVPSSWSGTMTCVAASANDTALFASTFTTYTKAFSTNTVGGNAMPTSYQLVAGQYYATAVIIVTAAALPGFYAFQNPTSQTGMADQSRMCGALNGQTDLVFTTTVGALSSSTAAVWSKVTT